jgi:hypothetical protein
VSNSEAPFSYSIKHLGEILTLRGNNFEDFTHNLLLSSNIAQFKQLYEDLTGMNPVSVPVSTEQAVAAVQQAFPQATVVEDHIQPQLPVQPVQPQIPAQQFAPVAPVAPVAQAAPAAGVNCSHGPMKLMPAGISKKTGKPYNAFYACQWPTREEQCRTQPAA